MNHWRAALMVLLIAAGAPPAVSQQRSDRRQERRQRSSVRAPDVANARYGSHERNVLDLWRAKSDQPTPLVVYFHGGGFRKGDKSKLSPRLLRGCLRSGISVAAVNYRLSHHAPYPAQMLDAARAVQFLRSKSRQWNIDPKRVGATGSSAGGGISLWLAFHDDLADAGSADPVARESTRLTCAAVTAAQCSYDPRFIKKHIGGNVHKNPAIASFFGLQASEYETPRAHKLFEAASPITHATADDPPVLLLYNESDEPIPDNAPPGRGVHHPKFGHLLKKKLDSLGVPCQVKHRSEYAQGGKRRMEADMVAFFERQF